MATSTTSPVPTTSRKWLTIGVSVLALVIGLVLVYRQIAGSTIKEQKAAALKEKDAKELGNKNPGNGEAFSTRLEGRRKEIEEADALARKKAAAEAGTVNTSASGTSTLAGQDKPADPNFGLGTKILKSTGFPSGSPSDAQLDSYESRKEDNQKAGNKKMMGWEAASDKGNIAQSGATEQLLAQLVGGQTGTANDVPGTSNSNAATLEAYLRSQGQTQAAASKDAQFVKGLETKGIATPVRVQAGVGRFGILEGTAIPIIMRTAVSSDLAGSCRAVVEQDMYDTITASIRLIPAGTTVICTYNSEVVQGQDRLLLAITRLIFPNGSSVAMGVMEASDAQGKIGAPADVNTRFWRTFGSTFLIAAITRLTERSAPSNGVTINTASGGSSGGTAAGVLGEVAKKSLERNLNIKPELSLAPGDRLRIIVTRDMVLDPSITQTRQ
jgi:type IV secretory pathway VirB10-like protein